MQKIMILRNQKKKKSEFKIKKNKKINVNNNNNCDDFNNSLPKIIMIMVKTIQKIFYGFEYVYSVLVRVMVGITTCGCKDLKNVQKSEFEEAYKLVFPEDKEGKKEEEEKEEENLYSQKEKKKIQN